MLNRTSYVHVKIRKLCQLLAYLTDMKLVTEFDENFEDVRFVGKYGYLTIDYKHRTIFVMSHKITPQEQEIIEEIMLYLDWLETKKNINGLRL